MIYITAINVKICNTSNMRVLVVEDEKRLAGIIKRGFLEEGYAVDNAYDGEEAQFMAENTPYDIIILDIMLPKSSGIVVCQELRRKKINIPILMLTAKDSIEDKVSGLDSGADDYLVKPFAFEELLARVRALLRRDTTSKTAELVIGNLKLDTRTREVWRGNRKIELTAKEYSMLEFFMRHPRQVITRTMLEENIWDYEFDGISNIIDVYMRRLRSKIDENGENSLFQTLRGVGYRMERP
jgi:DNA-binding response OmpR family regulator